MNKRKPNKIIDVGIVAGIFFGSIFLLHIFVGGPILGYSTRLTREFAQKQKKLSDSESLIRNLPNPQKEIDEIEGRIRELKEKGITPKQIPRLIQMLAGPAAKTDLNVISIRPREDLKLGAEGLPQGVDKVFIEIAVSGSYQSIGEYVKALNELPLAFTVEGLTMQKRGDQAGYYAARRPSEKTEGKGQELLATLVVSVYTMWEI